MLFYSDVNRQDPLVDPLIYDLEAVYQSIDTILNTRKGERLFLPEFGVDLEKYLFDLGTWATQNQIFLEIYNALEMWEPRIDLILNKSGVEFNDLDHELNINIVFSIKGKKYEEYVYHTKLIPKQRENYYGI